MHTPNPPRWCRNFTTTLSRFRLEESYGVCDDIVSPAIMKRGEENHLPPGWTTWVVAVLLFPTENISYSLPPQGTFSNVRKEQPMFDNALFIGFP